jgi:hypothetical protein
MIHIVISIVMVINIRISMINIDITKIIIRVITIIIDITRIIIHIIIEILISIGIYITISRSLVLLLSLLGLWYLLLLLDISISCVINPSHLILISTTDILNGLISLSWIIIS